MLRGPSWEAVLGVYATPGVADTAGASAASPKSIIAVRPSPKVRRQKATEGKR